MDIVIFLILAQVLGFCKTGFLMVFYIMGIVAGIVWAKGIPVEKRVKNETPDE